MILSLRRRDVRIAVPREIASGERRVALVPESCKKLIQAGYEISIETGAGDAAGFGGDEYSKLGVSLVPDPAALIGAADLILKVGPARSTSGR
jgi:NAD(P) transhydrogenase subunit alpha